MLEAALGAELEVGKRERDAVDEQLDTVKARVVFPGGHLRQRNPSAESQAGP